VTVEGDERKRSPNMPPVPDPVLRRNPHLKQYLGSLRGDTGRVPEFYEALSEDMVDMGEVNIIYPLGDPIFIHIFHSHDLDKGYHAIEPRLSKAEVKLYNEILNRILDLAPRKPHHRTAREFEKVLDSLIDDTTVVGKPRTGARLFRDLKVTVTRDQLARITYHIKRDLMANGIIDPLLRDPYIEDIHAVGLNRLSVVHMIFETLPTNVRFGDDTQLDHFLRAISERIGKPVSDSKPIVDAALPDGSRINIVYSDDVSKGGASFTIRKFLEKPPTMVQLIKWGTFSTEMAAYLWLCLEYGMSIFVSGETASGKTTSLNSMLSFIDFDKKIYSAEDTPEVVAPQPIWQRLVTRETGPMESRVELFDLVKTALRSRPDYIVIGEVRGREGNVAFQAIQTGHAVLSTFHASSIQKMIQRFTGEPINVPIRFMDNLNLALFQEIIYEGGRIMRRCSSIEEVLRYSAEKGGVLTRAVFRWDPLTDRHNFRGMFNSHILENKIAPKMGIEDVREIYEELKYRAYVMQNLVDDNLVGYDEVNALFKEYSEGGFDAIPAKYR